MGVVVLHAEWLLYQRLGFCFWSMIHCCVEYGNEEEVQSSIRMAVSLRKSEWSGGGDPTVLCRFS